MVMHFKTKYSISSLFLLLAFFIPHFATASTQSTIGVFREDNLNYKIFDPSNGDEITSSTLESKINSFKNNDFEIKDMLSNEGAEWVTDTDDGKLGIYNQSFDLIDQFNVFSNYSRPMAIAIGNVSTDYNGPEIIVCKSSSSVPRLKVFSYSSGGVEEKILGFKPFGDGSAHDRGCLELGVGDFDGDGDNEIITFRGHEKGGDIQVKIFDNNADLESTFEIPESLYEWSLNENTEHMMVANINSTNKDEIIFQGGTYMVYAYNSEGNQLYKFNSQKYNGKYIKKIDVSDIDGDGVAEVVVQQMGKKVPIVILNKNGEVENSYNLYPNATSKAARFMFLGQFSTGL
ncbi:MAG: hypothetical protein Q8P90_04835 [bacterium]|nr:hypothetical protein [bacterium]